MLGRIIGPKLAARADLVRLVGLRHALRRRHDAEARRALAAARERVYERIWAEAAAEAGATSTPLGDGRIELRRGDRVVHVRQQRVPLDDDRTLALALDKPAVLERLAETGLPVPEWVEVTARDTASAERLVAGGPVVVKPASGTGGGESITSGVETERDLRRALLRAFRSDARAIVERQVSGEVYRLLLLDGELVDTLHRLPPRLVGDGRSSVEQLVAAENERKIAADGAAGLELLLVDLDCLFTLHRQGLSLGSVVAAGRTFVVKNVTNENRTEDNESVRPVCADLYLEAKAAAAAIGVRLAGVDVLTPDPRRSLREAGGHVLEVNGTPGLHHHYLVANADTAPKVAVSVLRKLLD